MEQKKGLVKYFWQVTYAHTISYFIAGIIATAFFDYREWWSSEYISAFYRDFEAPIVALGGGDGTVTITGGTIEATGSYSNAVQQSGNHIGTMTITDGMIEATGNNSTAVSNIGSGVVTISGGTVSATGSDSRAVYNWSGTVNITEPPAVIIGTRQI